MSRREWKPGDVARVQYDGVDQVGIVRRRKTAGGALEIAYVSGSYDYIEERDGQGFARPLVVIDPEDAEQVERLMTLVDEWASQVPYEDMRKPGDLTGESALANALREFANPTPPQCSSELALREVIVECDLEVGHTQWHESRGCGVTWA